MKSSNAGQNDPNKYPLGDQPNSNDLIVVGIGASAGGVQALKTFVENIEEGQGIAYVVILHLSPDFDSKLTEILQAATSLTVTRVTEKIKVRPDQVYVVPPNQHLMMVDDYISISPNMEVEDRRAPVDIFFRTLADAQGPKAVSVILSGTGANGSMGLKRVKELGGAAFVQNPREAEFNEMPRNAIATELVDEVLPVAEIPKKIVRYKQRLGLIHMPIESDPRPQDQQQALREVFSQLRVRTGHDFTNYKRPTLLRRIERRINVRNLPDLTAYAAFVQYNPEETTALLKDLLISVTNFYRDKKAFDALEIEVIPQLIRNRPSEQQIRVWVAGCATGEEAYSIAIMLAEQTMSVSDAPKIQIFATDIDEAAITHAREGLYTINDAADVSPERLRRFFNKEGDGYRIRREIREMVLFANHNFITDPPFSNLDLISCRNVLIYLNTTAQDRVMATFQFALKPHGFLFLGSSESADSATEFYSTFSREHHIYQKRPITASRTYPVPDAIPDFKLGQSYKTSTLNDGIPSKSERITFGDLHQRLLEQYAAPSVIVNEEYEIVHLTERVGRYLQVGGGEPSKNLLKLVKQELRLELRSILYQAVQRQLAMVTRNVTLAIEEHTETVKMHVRPVLNNADIAKGFILVIFEQVTDEAKAEDIVLTSDEPVARQLEEELIRVKTQLRASNEQHEFHAEELKASNEELQAMNEELRSAAEELETSKEELQSINEELRTVNQELKVKVEETTLGSNNLQNLINSVNIGTIFLDRSFKVAFFTPAARELFNLIPADHGRSLSDITGKLGYDNLITDVELVLEKLQSVEREVRTTDGRFFLMRILPYRTAEDRINGVVITFIDVSSRKRIEEALRASEERLRLVIESAKDFAIFTTDTDRRINSWNTGAQLMMGYSEQEIVGQLGDVIFIPEDRQKGDPLKEMKKAIDNGCAENERWHMRKDQTIFYGSGTVNPLRDNTGTHIGFVKIMRDLTEAKRNEQALRDSEERLRITLESAEMGVWDWHILEDRIKWNKQHYLMLGIEPQERETDVAFFTKFVSNTDVSSVTDKLYNAVKSGTVFQTEFRITRADNNEVRWMNGYGRTIEIDKQGNAVRMVGVMYDITERKRLEQQKEEFILIASHELRTPVTSIKGYTEVLQERFEKSQQKENTSLVRKLNAQVDRLSNLIVDLLDTTKIVEGQLKLLQQHFNLNELIQERVEELQNISSKHSLTFENSTPIDVYADRERIGQVLSNLITNAIKYSPDGGIIVIHVQGQANVIKVSIADEGIGISDDLRERVFDRFFRIGNSASNGAQGMGLGLYITAGIIHRHGGTIDVKSNKGRGSIFTFTLPVSA